VQVPIALGLGLWFLLRLTGNAWFLLLIGVCAGALAVGLLSRARLDGLVVELPLRSPLSVGDDVDGPLVVANAGTGRTTAAALTIRTEGLSELVVHVGPLDPGERVSVRVRRTAVGRWYAGRTVVLAVARPSLGFLMAVRAREVPTTRLTVHPRLRPVRLPALSADRAAGGGGIPVTGRGPEVLALREWRPGDDRGRIHWRSTARTGRPVLLERGDEARQRLQLVLVGGDDPYAVEGALEVAASISDAAMRAGHDVAVVAWHVDGPVLADATTRLGLLDWWSQVRDLVLPDPVELGSTLVAGFGAGSEVVLAGSHEIDNGWLDAARQAAPRLLLRRAEQA
jgi:uncharacterized protein (DUF58 family)